MSKLSASLLPSAAHGVGDCRTEPEPVNNRVLSRSESLVLFQGDFEFLAMRNVEMSSSAEEIRLKSSYQCVGFGN